MALPVVLQLYSVRDELEADFEGTIAKVKEFGYDGVEFAGLYGKSAEQVKKILADAGLTPVSAHVPLDELLSDTQAVVATYKEIGCKYIAVPYLPEDRRPGTEGFDRTIEDIKKIADVCNEQGIQLLYHNHDFEFKSLTANTRSIFFIPMSPPTDSRPRSIPAGSALQEKIPHRMFSNTAAEHPLSTSRITICRARRSRRSSMNLSA